jgi:hypothetical protein
MKKVLLAAIFMLIGSGVLFAEDQAKKFDIGDGGVVKIEPSRNTLGIQIIYNNVSEAPRLAKEKLGIDGPANRLIGDSVKFTVTLLDGSGSRICQQKLSFNEFYLDQTDTKPKILFDYQTAQCGINSFDRIGDVVVDYSRG